MMRKETTILNDWGDAFMVTTDGRRTVTLWYEKNSDGEFKKGRKLSPKQAREMADTLNEYADEIESDE